MQTYRLMSSQAAHHIESALATWLARTETQQLDCVKRGYPIIGYDSVRYFFVKWARNYDTNHVLTQEQRNVLNSGKTDNKSYDQDLSSLIKEAFPRLQKLRMTMGKDFNKNTEEKKEGKNAMANNNSKNDSVGVASCTKDALITAAKDGLKLAAAQKASRELTAAVRQLSGAAYPSAFFDSPTGNVLECLLVPIVLHALTQVIDVPSGATIQRACELAMTAEVKDKLSGVLDALVPTLSELGQRLESVVKNA